MDEEIKICPFRTYTEAFPPILKGNGEVVRSYFEPCLKEKCPAFYVSHGEHWQKYERCKRSK